MGRRPGKNSSKRETGQWSVKNRDEEHESEEREEKYLNRTCSDSIGERQREDAHIPTRSFFVDEHIYIQTVKHRVHRLVF